MCHSQQSGQCTNQWAITFKMYHSQSHYSLATSKPPSAPTQSSAQGAWSDMHLNGTDAPPSKSPLVHYPKATSASVRHAPSMELPASRSQRRSSKIRHPTSTSHGETPLALQSSSSIPRQHASERHDGFLHRSRHGSRAIAPVGLRWHCSSGRSATSTRLQGTKSNGMQVCESRHPAADVQVLLRLTSHMRRPPVVSGTERHLHLHSVRYPVVQSLYILANKAI